MNGNWPGRHLIKDDADREEIAARVRRLPRDLLGREIVQRAEDAGLADDLSGECVSSVGSALARPKSRIFTCPVGSIMMLAAFRSRWTMPPSCAAATPAAICRAMRQKLAGFDRPAPHPLRERFALAVLHDDERNAFAGLADFVDRGDVRVADRRGGPRFAHESARGDPRRRGLQRVEP